MPKTSRPKKPIHPVESLPKPVPERLFLNEQEIRWGGASCQAVTTLFESAYSGTSPTNPEVKVAIYKLERVVTVRIEPHIIKGDT